ncbi:MAG: cob(I)yrinic acid a,c-diamide adenosyltransferase [Desulfovibrio sp.]|jgi:cob(I)alamin adenosyltransferase|nr:cob(I)yrinic acid a,c-diamide adenosyltransferase [Desulfovibrio sp.]
MLLVYTGEGKGKSCACVGQALRALGQGLRVAFAQFLKRPGQAGEQRMLADLLGENFLAGGLGFFREESERPVHRRAVLTTLEWALARCGALDMLVLDEAVYALDAALLAATELESAMDACALADCHLVLSGRNAPGWLVERADLVTEMREVKHHYRSGVPARPGIEF